MTEISQKDAEIVADWIGEKFKKDVASYKLWKIDGNIIGESHLIHWLSTSEGIIVVIKKIITFAALHLEEIPIPEAVIMPFTDIAGKDDYAGHGKTFEDAILNSVLVLIKESEVHG